MLKLNLNLGILNFFVIIFENRTFIYSFLELKINVIAYKLGIALEKMFPKKIAQLSCANLKNKINYLFSIAAKVV